MLTEVPAIIACERARPTDRLGGLDATYVDDLLGIAGD
jgi:hypothetical protein